MDFILIFFIFLFYIKLQIVLFHLIIIILKSYSPFFDRDEAILMEILYWMNIFVAIRLTSSDLIQYYHYFKDFKLIWQIYVNLIFIPTPVQILEYLIKINY